MGKVVMMSKTKEMKKTNHETVEETNEKECNEEVTAKEESESEENKSEVEILEEKISGLKLALNESENKFLKAYADLENTKKRMQRDYNLSQKYKIQDFALNILPAIDNLERALAAEKEETPLKEGVQMIYSQIMSALEQEGVVAIESINKPFDPQLHQAMMTEKQEGVEANIVLEELQKGYMIKDRILRASLVKVSE